MDEIDTTPEAVQIRLLRVIQEREVMRVGGDRKIPVDVRIIAAAGRDLSLAVRDGKFRADLFFRLNVLRIQVPPLKARREDIPLLLGFFIDHFSDRHGLEPIRLPDAYIRKLKHYEWPGNVRQLRNFAERVVMNCSLRCSHDMLDVLYNELIEYMPISEPRRLSPERQISLKRRLKDQSHQTERAIIIEALEQARYRKGRAAEALGISRTTLWRKVRELGIE